MRNVITDKRNRTFLNNNDERHTSYESALTFVIVNISLPSISIVTHLNQFVPLVFGQFVLFGMNR